MAGLLDAFAQYIRDAMPGGVLNSEWNAQNIKRMDSEINRGLLESTGINARDKRRAWNKGLLDAVSGSDDTMSSINQQAFDSVMNLASIAPAGIIRAQGVIPKGALYPKEFSGHVVTPVMGSLPKSDMYDMAGMFPVEASGIGQLRRLQNGDFLATIDPMWNSRTKARYWVGDNPDELISAARNTSENSSKSIDAARTSKIPKEIRDRIENAYGKNFSYDISNAANSKSYYITHKPTGTKIRVSDHELPSYYENTANLDIGIEDANRLPEILGDYLKSNGLQK